MGQQGAVACFLHAGAAREAAAAQGVLGPRVLAPGAVLANHEHFTVVVDAATLSTGKMGGGQAQKGFYALDVLHPPEEVRGKDSVGAHIWVMFYMAIMKDQGVISGPDYMYWGSKTLRGKKGLRHYRGFPHWCVLGAGHACALLACLHSDLTDSHTALKCRSTTGDQCNICG